MSRKIPSTSRRPHQIHKGVDVGLALPARGCVPGVVVDVNARSPRLDGRDDRTEPAQPAWQVAVKVELVALVYADAWVSMPEHQTIEPAKLAEAVVEKRVERVAAGPAVVDSLVAHHHERAAER